MDTTRDPDWNLVSQWVDWGDGSEPSRHVPIRWLVVPNWASHSYSVPGTYTITMTATDTHGVTASKSVSVEVVDTSGTAGDPISGRVAPVSRHDVEVAESTAAGECRAGRREGGPVRVHRTASPTFVAPCVRRASSWPSAPTAPRSSPWRAVAP